MEGKKNEDSFVVRIGPKLKLLLERQKEIVNDITYNVMLPSDYDAGEVIAEKVTNSNIM